MNMPFDLLLGRKTFDIWAPFWPQHADEWPGVNTATKYVASNTLTSSEWQPSVFLNGDIAEKVAKIKGQPGPDLNVWGSGNLLQTLIKHDLVDAFWLMIYPITLGAGKRLFADGTIPAAFKVTESKVGSNGVIVVNYERAGAITTGSSEQQVGYCKPESTPGPAPQCPEGNSANAHRLADARRTGVAMILPKDRDPRFITIRRGGTLTDADHQLLALWAAACAEHVLHLFESVQPSDPRPRQAIEQARAWARGEIKMSQARTAGGHAQAAARDLSGAARHARVCCRAGRGGSARRRPRARRGGLRDQGRACGCA